MTDVENVSANFFVSRNPRLVLGPGQRAEIDEVHLDSREIKMGLRTGVIAVPEKAPEKKKAAEPVGAEAPAEEPVAKATPKPRAPAKKPATSPAKAPAKKAVKK